MKYSEIILAWAVLIGMAISIWSDRMEHACFFAIWTCFFLTRFHIDHLAERKQIGGDKMTITIEADTSQARTELASLQKQLEELSAAIHNAKGE